VFIDGGYFNKVLENDFNRPRIDYYKFSELLCDPNYERLRTYYYNCMPFQDYSTDEENSRYLAMEKFIHSLKRLPRFEIRLGKLERINGAFVQKRVDILLAVDLVRLSWGEQIKTAIIITGDSDFVPAVEAAKDAGVLVQLYYSKSSIHDELLSAVDESFEITIGLIEQSKI